MGVIETINQYPTNGTHKYHWVNGFDGVTQDLIYNKIRIASAEALKRTYCCGLTFEVWFKAFGQFSKVPAQTMKSIKADWFVATGKRKGPVDALVIRGLGTEVTDLSQARPGDFVQLWRSSGSGHSVVLLSLDNDQITYWSTQPITNGIGRRTELRSGKNAVTEIYVCKAKRV